jgi:hypothetical protein
VTAPRRSNSLLNLITHLANSRQIEAVEIANILATVSKPSARPLLRVLEKSDGELKFAVAPVPSL